MNNHSALVKGSYRVEVYQGDILVSDTGEFDNLITDAGLSGDAFPFSMMFGGSLYLCVGTGVVTTPAYSDTDLGNQVKAVADTGYGFNSFTRVGDAGVYPEVYKCSKVFEFTGIAGNISELGIRKGSATGLLISRSLVKDINGNPVTVTAAANQTVRVTYTVYSIIPSAVIDTGTLVTPFGTSDYTVHAGSSANGIHAMWFGRPLYHASATSVNYYKMALRLNDGASRVANSSPANSVDLANRKTTVSSTFNATGTDFQFNQIFGVDHPSYHKQIPWIQLDTPLTLPANYNFSFGWEFTWGRAS